MAILAEAASAQVSHNLRPLFHQRRPTACEKVTVEHSEDSSLHFSGSQPRPSNIRHAVSDDAALSFNACSSADSDAVGDGRSDL
jgi:hypothetical protein